MRETIWSPTWDARIDGWVRKFIRQNSWRVDHLHDFDDLMQDAYIVFMRVKAAYPRVTEPKHFMALFKVAMLNNLINKTRVKQRIPVIQELTAMPDPPDFSNEGELLAALSRLPEDVQKALSVFGDTQKCIELRPKKGRRVFENLNMKLTRVAGLSTHVDVLGHLRRALCQH